MPARPTGQVGFIVQFPCADANKTDSLSRGKCSVGTEEAALFLADL